MRSILNYIGKMPSTYIRKYVDKSIKTYIEPFAGSFNCGFNLMEEGYMGNSVLNDLDTNVYNFWCCVKQDPERLMKTIVELYADIMGSDNINKIMELEKYSKSTEQYLLGAYEYLYRSTIKLSYESDIIIKEPYIDRYKFIDASVRLLDTTILNRNCFDILDMYDSENTFFMIDPPYNVKNINRYYRCNSSEFNHKQLHDRVQSLKGKWVVRYNDEPYTADLYRDTKILLKTTKNIIGTDFTEIYYSNICE